MVVERDEAEIEVLEGDEGAPEVGRHRDDPVAVHRQVADLERRQMIAQHAQDRVHHRQNAMAIGPDQPAGVLLRRPVGNQVQFFVGRCQVIDHAEELQPLLMAVPVVDLAAGTPAGQAALLHAIAHIEFTAINLARLQ